MTKWTRSFEKPYENSTIFFSTFVHNYSITPCRIFPCNVSKKRNVIPSKKTSHGNKKFHRHNLIFHAKKSHHVFSNLNFRVQLFHLLSLAKYSRVMFRREKALQFIGMKFMKPHILSPNNLNFQRVKISWISKYRCFTVKTIFHSNFSS